ncbi:MAG TPA: PGPGW domain-containing protein [Acidimicrobiales bacterium]|nr:PGPGW domain-containing protein [Acidimicrobiales bacterium]
MAPKPAEVVRFLARSTKRIAVTVVGGVFVLGGLAMLVLPGPGFLVVVIGFAILGTEYAWAAAALERTKETAEKASKAAKRTAKAAGRRVKRSR